MSVLDDFNRADGGLGANWTSIVGPLNIFTNRVSSTATGDNCSTWTATVFAANHLAQIVVAAPSADSTGGAGPGVRLGGTNDATLRGYVMGANSDRVTLYRIDPGPTYTLIAATLNAADLFVANDVAKVVATGSAIGLYKNGTQTVGVGDTTDATYATGAPGLFFFSGQLSSFGDDWFASATTTTTHRPHPGMVGGMRELHGGMHG